MWKVVHVRMQVLRYALGQFYDSHRDYWDPAEFPDKHRFIHPNSKTWFNRHATLLWYLQRPEEGSGWYRQCQYAFRGRLGQGDRFGMALVLAGSFKIQLRLVLHCHTWGSLESNLCEDNV